MRYAHYVGRVGALAVALGVGAAVTWTPGMAWASPNDSSSSSGISGNSTASGSPSTPDTGGATTGSPGQPIVGAVKPDAKRTHWRGPDDAGSSAGSASRGDHINVGTRKRNEPAWKASKNPLPTDAAAAGPGTVKPSTADNALSETKVFAEPTLRFAATRSSLAPAVASLHTLTASTESTAGQRFSSLTEPRVAQRLAPTPKVATILLSSLLAPLVAGGPAAPAEPPAAWALLAWARRQFGQRAGEQTETTVARALSSSQTLDDVNSAPTARASVGRPNRSTGVVSGSVVGRDPDRDTLSYTAPPTTAKGGTVAIRTAWSGVKFTYTPSGAARHTAAADGATAADKTDSFTVTVDDGHGNTIAVPITVSIAPANARPTRPAATVTHVNPNTGAVTVAVSASDADSDALMVSAPASTKKGAIVVSSDGTLTYTPTAAARQAASVPQASNWVKTDAFTATINDGHGGTTLLRVTVNITPVGGVNTPPIANAIAGQPDSEGVVTGSVTATDPDWDTLTYSAPAATTKGTIELHPDGSFTYKPTDVARHNAAADNAAATGANQDSFTITVSDSFGGTASAPVTVTIKPSNTSPSGANVSAPQPDATGRVSGSVTASDAEHDTLTYSGSTTTSKGSVTVDPSGTFIYQANDTARHKAAATNAPDSDKQDSFTVTVNDGHGGSLNVPVTVTIGPANTAPEHGSASVDQPLSNGWVTGSVTASDSDHDTLTYSGSTTTSKGSVVVNNTTGAFTYKPTADARHNASANNASDIDKIDTFTVTVSDGHGGALDVPVTVTIKPSNDFPTVQSTTFGNPDPETGKVTGTIVASDPNNDPLKFSLYSGPLKGSVIVNDDGTFTYTPTDAARHNAAIVNGSSSFKTDSFNVRVDDGHGGAYAVIVGEYVEIAPKNAAPTASPTSGTTDAVTGAKTGSVGATDPDHDGMSYTVSGNPTNGAVTVSTSGTYTYTPTGIARLAAYVSPTPLTDTFTVTVNDQHGATIDVPITVQIDPSAYVLTSGGIPGYTYNDYEFDSGNLRMSPDGTHAFVQTYNLTYDPQSGDKWTVQLSVVGADGTVSSSPVAANAGGRPRGFVMSPDGSRAYMNTYTYDSATQTATTTITVMNADGSSAVLAPITGFASVDVVSGRTYLVAPGANNTTTVSVLNADNARTAIASLDGALNGFTVTPDKTRAYITTSYVSGTTPVTRVAVLWPNNTVGTLTTRVGFSPSNGVVVSPAGDRAYQVTYATNGQGQTQTTILAIKPDESVTALPTFAGYPTYNQIVFSADGSRAYTTSGGQLLTINANNTFTNGPTFTDYIDRIAVSPDGKYVYVATDRYDSARSGFDYRISVVGPSGTATPLGSYAFIPGNVGQSPISGIVVSPDGTRAYITTQTANSDQTANVYTLTFIDGASRTLTQINVPGWFEGNSRNVNFHVPGTGGLTATTDGRAYLTFVGGPTGYSMLVVQPDRTSTIVALPGSPDNGGLIASPDGTKVYVVTTAYTNGKTTTTVSAVGPDGTLTELATVAGAQADAVTFSPDGMRLYLVTSDLSFPVHAIVNTIYIPPAGPPPAGPSSM